MDYKNRILDLRRQLHEHNNRYYVLNSPIISDMEFDMLMHELQDLEAQHPDMFDENSPTQRVGSDLNKEFTQGERYAISTADDPDVVRETEKAFLLKWKTEFGTIQHWAEIILHNH